MTRINGISKDAGVKEAKNTFERAFRFICHLNLQDHSVAEQREQLELIREMKDAARSVQLTADELAVIARDEKSVDNNSKATTREDVIKRVKQGKCVVCSHAMNVPKNRISHIKCWDSLNSHAQRWYAEVTKGF